MPERIWITWEVQRRNQSMSKMLNASLHELVINAPSWKRYPVLIARTIALVWRIRPEIIFAQNPSIVLATLSVILGRLQCIPVIIDAHNVGLFPAEGKYGFLNKLARLINNRANIVIVSNAQLKAYVESNGGTAYVIPDPVPEIDCKRDYAFSSDIFNVVYVCSWADDEPYEEVISAAKLLDKTVRIYMTGNSKVLQSVADPAGLPENVVLTGFLSNHEYDALLCGCDAIMVLTTRDDCLVCGAYESVSVEKPLILSNKTILKQYFNKGCIYSENADIEISEAIKLMIREQTVLAGAIKEFKSGALKDTAAIIHDFNEDISRLCER